MYLVFSFFEQRATPYVQLYHFFSRSCQLTQVPYSPITERKLLLIFNEAQLEILIGIATRMAIVKSEGLGGEIREGVDICM